MIRNTESIDIQVAKRTMKDSIFTHAFRDPKNILLLYKELHPEDVSVTENDIEVVTLENILVDGPVNDVGFIVGDTVLCMAEAQTTRMKGILLRYFIYLAHTLERYMMDRRINYYSANEDNIPVWEMYVIFSKKAGIEGGPQIWRFDSIGGNLFDISNRTIVNIRKGGIVEEYTELCEMIDNVISQYGHGKDALKRIFDICKERDGPLTEFIESKEFEIMTLYEQLWTKEGNIQMNIEEAERRGRSDEQIRISLSMLNDGVPPETVSKYTGLSLTDI